MGIYSKKSYKAPSLISKATKPGKPYEQQPGRKRGKGKGKIVHETISMFPGLNAKKGSPEWQNAMVNMIRFKAQVGMELTPEDMAVWTEVMKKNTAERLIEKRDEVKKVPLRDALCSLGDGHAVWKVPYAKGICQAVGVKWSDDLAETFKSDMGPDNPKGLLMNPGMEQSKGVDGGYLARYCAEQLGVANKAGQFMGRGSQARAYAAEVAKVVKK